MRAHDKYRHLFSTGLRPASIFCFVGLLWMSLEHILPSLGRLWASFWEPLGRLGFPRGSPWRPFGSLGTPWSHLGHLGLPSGAWNDLGSKMDVQFRANGSQVARLRTKRDLAEFSRQCGVWAQSAARAAAPNPTSLAPGARMTVVKHTPSND